MNISKKLALTGALSLWATIATAHVHGHVRKNESPANILDKAGSALKYYMHRAHDPSSSTPAGKELAYTRVHDNKILLDITTFADTQRILQELTDLGLTDGAFFYKQISGFMPLDKIEALLAHPGVRFATASQFKTRTGSTTSQGDAAMGSNIARSEFGVSGAGIKVATISDSFNALNGYAADIASGDLPSNVVIVKDSPGTDEGRAMVQIVHDIAPGALLYFRSAAFGEADFAQGIKDLAYAGVHIINDDLQYFTEPMFQDGIIAQAATYAVEIGTHYISAAGNNDELSYQAPFRNSGIAPPSPVSGPGLSGFAHDFDPGPGVDILQRFVLAPDDNLTLTFQWPQPFVSACEGDCQGPVTDFDLGLYDSLSNTYVALANDNNIVSGAPVEILSYVNNSVVNQNLDLVIVKRIGPETPLIKYIELSGVSPTEFNLKSPTSFGHTNSDKVISVASAAWYNIPPEEPVPLFNDDSSTGGIPIYFDLHNNLLPTPLIRENPDVTGPDGGNTTFFGEDIVEDADLFPNFFGTSAATPHVAGLAALILDNAKGKISPSELETILEVTALDVPDPQIGFDYKTGFGLVQAAGSEGAVCADIDNDNTCINIDECVDVAAKVNEGRCGCDVAEGACKPRRSAGSGGFLVPTNLSGFFPIPSKEIAPNPSPLPDDARPAIPLLPKSPQKSSSTSLERGDPPSTSASCSGPHSPSDALVLGMMFAIAWRRRQKNRN